MEMGNETLVPVLVQALMMLNESNWIKYDIWQIDYNY